MENMFWQDSADSSEFYVKFFAPLRNSLVSHLDIMNAGKNEKKTHDSKALKRSPHALRMGEKTGRKVLIAYDPACIDFHFWWRLKTSKGVYFLTRETANMKLGENIIGEKEFDKSDPRNENIESDTICSCHAGVHIRRIVYTDPLTKQKYVFVTNEMTLPPGVICYVYKLRWNIEKVFDTFKNSFNEKKAWTKNKTGKVQQAVLMCLAHNLLTLLSHKLKKDEKIEDRKCVERYSQRVEALREKLSFSCKNPLLYTSHKPTKFSLQFLRVIKDRILIPTSWSCFLGLIRPAMSQYFY